MEKLSIYGGTGFVGSNYVKKFPDNQVMGRNEYVPYTEDILYFISTVDNYNIFTDPHVDINTNLNVLISVLEECRKKKIKGVFNFISSWFVYGKSGFFIDEETVCEPKGFYSITKRTAEQLLISYCETFKMKYRILRLANVVGKDDKKVSPKKNVLQFLIEKLKKDEPIELQDRGDFFREYIHVKDCVDAINLVVNDKEYNQIYNISCDHALPLKRVIEIAHTKLNSKSRITYTYNNKVQSIGLTNHKIKKLGFVPKYNIEKIVEDLIT
jgi:nucleoside-diphosphate-sugar epimerase